MVVADGGGGVMSYMNRLEPPEPDYTDEEWDFARFQVCSELIREGVSRREAERMADDLTVADQVEFNHRKASLDAEAERADVAIKARKEGL